MCEQDWRDADAPEVGRSVVFRIASFARSKFRGLGRRNPGFVVSIVISRHEKPLLGTIGAYTSFEDRVNVPMRMVTFVSRPANEAAELRQCDEKPAWLSREQIILKAREAVSGLPDDSRVMIVEPWQRFPRRAIAVIPPDGLGKFAISKEPVDVTDPSRFLAK